MKANKLFNITFWSCLYFVIVISVYFLVPELSNGELVLQDGIWQQFTGTWDDWVFLPDGTSYMIGGRFYEPSSSFDIFIISSILGWLLMSIRIYIQKEETK